ncbi:MAG: hypothetical protein ACK52R_01065, partial [Betaproteobacteria bacterium]
IAAPSAARDLHVGRRHAPPSARAAGLPGIRGRAPRRPAAAPVLARSPQGRARRGQQRADDMLGIMGDARGITMSADRIDRMPGRATAPAVFRGRRRGPAP